ncbi:hypothetical protein DACRYDRAFT_80602 [Dacryopinax primogenitus]|uniref:SGT1-domain-containing protein n=1 Tax=Dacryopinax primogenitus (strain DJM 731) TaxID=1858805 RepID=M5FYY9_DACPD|nr:uncharacterized protein DACRYDRAFT_80602 [Dacryopinax primogenitus]EJU01115.1 hypothetical protein DACRYDRAFT_80602 [Dacryopinax primogenitus]
MDIFNRSPSISDDTLRYSLHFPTSKSTESELSTLTALILEHVDRLLPPDFLWHRDAFELRLAGTQAKGKGKTREGDVKEGDAWLEGTMRVGDAVDDEWAVVWLLREVSTAWDCIISVMDSDGQFLLIEAADSLPGWVTPSNSENRVWIYRSQLHLVPLSYVSPASSRSARSRLDAGSDDELDLEDADTWISVPDALRLVRDDNVPTLAPPSVQNALQSRLARYPSALAHHTHHAFAFLPVPIAQALSRSPSLIQRASEAFYTRDALQLRSAHKMSRFPPSPSLLSKVSMTRVAYAQLRGQRWTPPRVFGPSPKGARERHWWELGAMLSAGFEMLYQETRARQALSGQSREAKLEALQRDTGWEGYVQGLQKAGFFSQEVRGSQLWKEKEDKAVQAYVSARVSEDATRPSFASLVENALVPPLPDEDAIRVSPQSQEDDDSWLSVRPQQLGSLLTQLPGNPAPSSMSPPRSEPKIHELNDVDMDEEEERLAHKEAERLRDMARKVEGFVQGEGELEGATFPDLRVCSDILDDDMPDSDDESDVEMEPPPTEEQLQKAMDTLVRPLAAGEYGKMPEDWNHAKNMTDPALAETEAKMSAPKPGEGVPATGKGKGKELVRDEPLEPLDMTLGHRAPLFERETYEGHSSDSDLDPAGQGLSDEESGEDAPQVVDEEVEVEPDMQAEEEEFLQFARRELGINDVSWGEIVRQREGEGRFVPRSTGTKEQPQERETFGPELLKPKTKGQPKRSAGAKDKASEKAVRWTDATPAPMPADRTPRQRREGGPRPKANPILDSFERVMDAMEAELAKARAQGKGKSKPASRPNADVKGKGKARPEPEVESDEDEDAMLQAMDAELRSSLKQAEEDTDADDETPMDYNLIKNFLESFKSQAGLAGPVSGMVGRLEKGWVWPRDEKE